MIHQVQALPKEGEYVRAKCGRRIANRHDMAVHKSDAPAGAEFCRGSCWRQSLSDKAKVVLLEDLVRSISGETVPAEAILAILEDRYYPQDSTESPKAA